MFLLTSDAFYSVAEDVIDAFIEAHDVDRCYRFVLLRPKAGEARVMLVIRQWLRSEKLQYYRLLM